MKFRRSKIIAMTSVIYFVATQNFSISRHGHPTDHRNHRNHPTLGLIYHPYVMCALKQYQTYRWIDFFVFKRHQAHHSHSDWRHQVIKPSKSRGQQQQVQAPESCAPQRIPCIPCIQCIQWIPWIPWIHQELQLQLQERCG